MRGLGNYFRVQGFSGNPNAYGFLVVVLVLCLFSRQVKENIISKESPNLLLLGHTYEARDWIPRLSARLNLPFISDCINFKMDSKLTLVRSVYQGKFNSDLSVKSEKYILSFQSGAFRADKLQAGTASTRNISVDLSGVDDSIQPGEKFQESETSVDLSQADIIISALDPKLTFLKLIDENELPSDFIRDIQNFRIRGSSGKVNLALDRLPDFTSLPGEGPHLRGAISISPSYDHLERAYDDAKYGNFSREPYMDIILPSMLDPDMAPPGKHVMSCFVQYAPYDIKGGWDDEKREKFGDAVINTLSRFAPNIKDIILHRQVLTPKDIETTFGLTEGNIFHGELTLQQLFSLRPAVKWADYTTPITNYFQCGSGTHPGGGITGSPGEMAAKQILRKWA